MERVEDGLKVVFGWSNRGKKVIGVINELLVFDMSLFQLKNLPRT